MITIPIRVLTSHEIDYENWETSNDESGWLFGDGTEYTHKQDKKHYSWFGSMSWFRCINPIDLIAFLPTAIAFERLNNYKLPAAARFKWLLKWWSQIVGWGTTTTNIVLAILMINGQFTNENSSFWTDSTFQVIASLIITGEIVG